MSALQMTKMGRINIDGTEIDCVVLQGSRDAIREAGEHLGDNVKIVSPPFSEMENDMRDEAQAWCMRDRIASQALAGLLANPNHKIGTVTFAQIVKDAYLFADAMMEARK